MLVLLRYDGAGVLHQLRHRMLISSRSALDTTTLSAYSNHRPDPANRNYTDHDANRLTHAANNAVTHLQVGSRPKLLLGKIDTCETQILSKKPPRESTTRDDKISGNTLSVKNKVKSSVNNGIP